MGLRQENTEMEFLQTLGLTQNQARVYLALIQFEKTTAKILATTSKLAACDVYRVIPELHKLGLLEILVTSPKEFQATPPEDAIKILLRRRKEDYERTQMEAKDFLKGIHLEKVPPVTEIKKTALIPCGYRAIQFGTPKLLATKKRLDAIQTNRLFHRFINNSADDLKKLLRRKVEMRFIVENPRGIEKPNEDLDALLKYLNFKVRFAKNKIKACILLHDDTDAFISTSLDPIHTPSYWSSNPCMIAVTRSYFETTWKKATEKPKVFNINLTERQIAKKHKFEELHVRL
ncbi:MAG: hypothetical protein NWF05_00985 [Candidatus Bathyarchaeota archaeon]|nr:hypothetical protein [Candidatus Bathyarchaeota archaeon]